MTRVPQRDPPSRPAGRHVNSRRRCTPVRATPIGAASIVRAHLPGDAFTSRMAWARDKSPCMVTGARLRIGSSPMQRVLEVSTTFASAVSVHTGGSIRSASRDRCHGGCRRHCSRDQAHLPHHRVSMIKRVGASGTITSDGALRRQRFDRPFAPNGRAVRVRNSHPESSSR